MVKQFRRLNPEDLEMVLRWRNHPDVRKNMYTHDEISLDDHIDWYEGIKDDDSKLYFVFEDEEGPQGLVGFTQIDHVHQRASWFFYSGNLEKRGLGGQMERWALDYVFNKLHLNKLCCEVLEFNMPVVRFHQKHGFQIEGVLRKHYQRDSQFYDIYQLALDKKTYEKSLNKNEKFKVGQTYEVNFSVSEQNVAEFAKLSGDENPVHLEDESAKALGFKGRIAHGFLVSSVFSRIFGCKFPGAGTIYLNQSMDFLAPVYPGDQLVAKFKIISLVGRRALISTTIESYKGVVVSGQATVLIYKENKV